MVSPDFRFQNVWSQYDYWASLLVFAYQPRVIADGDPDAFTGVGNTGPPGNEHYDEMTDFGVTVGDSDNASIVYVETQRDLGLVADKDFAHTVAHEMGHAQGFGRSAEQDHEEDGLMSEDVSTQDCCFYGRTLLRFRSGVQW